MNIRLATTADIAQLTELKKPQKEEHRKKFFQNQIKRLQEMEEGKVIYLVGEEDGKIIAHLLLQLQGIPTEAGCPNINDLYVSEDVRSKGYGSELLQKAEEIAKEKGFTKISLAVNPTLNPRAKTLYEKLGYQQTDTKPYVDGVYDGVKDWCVDMVKKL